MGFLKKFVALVKGMPDWHEKYNEDLGYLYKSLDAIESEAGRSIVPCNAAYDATNKVHVLTPVNSSQSIPTSGMVPVTFIPDADFHAGDKLRFNGQDCNAAYNNTDLTVADGAFRAGFVTSAIFQFMETNGTAVLQGGAAAYAKNAGTHNAIYRGKYLGTSVTAAQYAAIAAGTFDDLYIGDYWTIGSVNYRIAAFDYYLRCGDSDLTTHHVVIVPDSNLYNAKMNDTNTAEGGYVGSAMYKTNLAQAKTTIKAAFNGHVLNHRIYLVNAVTDGAPSAGAWCDSEVDLMTERMVYGCPVFSPMGNGSTDPWSTMQNYTVEKSQLALFAHRPDLISNRLTFWLRDVVTASHFAGVYYNGHAAYGYAGDSFGVRPAFCIY